MLLTDAAFASFADLARTYLNDTTDAAVIDRCADLDTALARDVAADEAEAPDPEPQAPAAIEALSAATGSPLGAAVQLEVLARVNPEIADQAGDLAGPVRNLANG